VIYLYAIVPRLSGLPSTQGIGGGALQTVDTEALSAVCSSHEQLDLRVDAQSAWDHEHVVESLMALGPVLPARFGTTFQDEDAVRLALSRDVEALECGLARVCGCVELAVRVRAALPSDGESRSSTDGHSYVREMLQARQQRETMITDTVAPLRAFAVNSKLSATASGEAGISVSYLVRTHDVDRFCAEVRRIQNENQQLALSCTGPWAPYSFTSETVAS
jgi:hypothetical protein